jgi:hypothetical protein
VVKNKRNENKNNNIKLLSSLHDKYVFFKKHNYVIIVFVIVSNKIMRNFVLFFKFYRNSKKARSSMINGINIFHMSVFI